MRVLLLLGAAYALASAGGYDESEAESAPVALVHVPAPAAVPEASTFGPNSPLTIDATTAPAPTLEVPASDASADTPDAYAPEATEKGSGGSEDGGSILEGGPKEGEAHHKGRGRQMVIRQKQIAHNNPVAIIQQQETVIADDTVVVSQAQSAVGRRKHGEGKRGRPRGGNEDGPGGPHGPRSDGGYGGDEKGDHGEEPNGEEHNGPNGEAPEDVPGNHGGIQQVSPPLPHDGPHTVSGPAPGPFPAPAPASGDNSIAVTDVPEEANETEAPSDESESTPAPYKSRFFKARK